MLIRAHSKLLKGTAFFIHFWQEQGHRVARKKEKKKQWEDVVKWKSDKSVILQVRLQVQQVLMN